MNNFVLLKGERKAITETKGHFLKGNSEAVRETLKDIDRYRKPRRAKDKEAKANIWGTKEEHKNQCCFLPVHCSYLMHHLQ